MKKSSTLITKITMAMTGLAIVVTQVSAQVPLSGGTYTQNFDSLPGAVGNNPWTNNQTLLGWYSASQSQPASQGGYTNIVGSNGGGNAGVLYSFTNSSAPSDRTLGSISSGTPANITYGIRFTNDTGFALSNLTIGYTGEQFRNGGNTSPQTLAFSYRIDDLVITNSDPAGTSIWNSVTSLNFISPTVGATAAALDGNNPANRTIIPGVELQNITLFPGQEIFFRWLDINDGGNDHALGLDDLSFSFQTNLTAVPAAPVIFTQPASTTNVAGGSATFTVAAGGKQPFIYEWYATNAGSSILVGSSGSFTTNVIPIGASGYKFFVIITNSLGSVTSSVATLTVTNVSVVETNIGYLHTLQNASFALTNTSTLFSATGVVITPANLVDGTLVYSFHIQDHTGGIDVFHRGGFVTDLPQLGDMVRVTAPLLQFNGFLEFAPTNANPTHEMVILSSGNPLPEPLYFDFTTIDPVVMESTYEGRYVVISNVFLAVTNVSGLVEGGKSIFATNLTGQVFRLFNPVDAIDPQGLPLPAFAKSVRGVMTQNDGSAPFDSGYNMYLSTDEDIEVGVAPPAPEPLTIQVVGTDVVLSWAAPAFNLQASSLVTGTYTNVPGATSPFTYPISGGAKYFRLQYTLP